MAPEEWSVDYYEAQRRESDAFEAHVATRIAELSPLLAVTRHRSKAAQLAHGDLRINGQDVELKYDHKLERTRNVFVECEAKEGGRRGGARAWAPSGIYARSTAAWYGIGNYRTLILFAISQIRAAAPPPDKWLTIHMETARGFLLTPAQRAGLQKLVVEWPAYAPNGMLVASAIFGGPHEKTAQPDTRLAWPLPAGRGDPEGAAHDPDLPGDARDGHL